MSLSDVSLRFQRLGWYGHDDLFSIQLMLLLRLPLICISFLRFVSSLFLFSLSIYDMLSADADSISGAYHSSKLRKKPPLVPKSTFSDDLIASCHTGVMNDNLATTGSQVTLEPKFVIRRALQLAC